MRPGGVHARLQGALLIGLVLGLGGCKDVPTRPEEFEEFGVFAIRLGGFDGDSSNCHGHHANPLSIRMSRLDGSGDASTILLDVEGTPAEFVIGGPAGSKIAIFNSGGDAYAGGSNNSCDGGDAGRVSIALDEASGVSAEEAFAWTYSNPLEDTVTATRDRIAPIAYYVTRGGRPAGGSAGANANVFVGTTLVPPEAFDAGRPSAAIAAWESAFGEGNVYDVTEDLRALTRSGGETTKYRITWRGRGKRPEYTAQGTRMSQEPSSNHWARSSSSTPRSSSAPR